MGDRSEKVTGGCLCGAVRYEVEAYLHNAFYCHCRMCQRASGAPVQWVFTSVRKRCGLPLASQSTTSPHPSATGASAQTAVHS